MGIGSNTQYSGLSERSERKVSPGGCPVPGTGTTDRFLTPPGGVQKPLFSGKTREQGLGSKNPVFGSQIGGGPLPPPFWPKRPKTLLRTDFRFYGGGPPKSLSNFGDPFFGVKKGSKTGFLDPPRGGGVPPPKQGFVYILGVFGLLIFCLF